MSDDFFMNGVNMPGGASSDDKLRMLLLYMLRMQGGAAGRSALVNTVCKYGLANYFEAEQTIFKLLELGLVRETSVENVGKILSLTKSGDSVEKTLRDALLTPVLRSRAEEALAKGLGDGDGSIETDVSSSTADGASSVTMTASQNGKRIMSLTLCVSGRDEADAAAQRFRDSPGELCELVLGFFSGGEDK
ncbi:MAG: DUF4364 family protein [Clostridia bacterium]|nr:DUF4364 family protein [Clostridia bacterium]